MNDDRDRFDFSPLDPAADPARVSRVTDAVLARATPALRARREREPQLWLQMARWRARVLATAVAVAAVASVVIVRMPATRTAVNAPGTAAVASRAERAPATLAEAAGVPAGLARYAELGSAAPAASSLDLTGGTHD